MVSISLPLQSKSDMFSEPQHPSDSLASPSPPAITPRRHSSTRSPLPNPAFVFPARDPEDDSQTRIPTATTPPKSTCPDRPALPTFSFNPGGGGGGGSGGVGKVARGGHSSQPSMPLLSSPPRNTGHRRQCSELIGAERPSDTNPKVPYDTGGKSNPSLDPSIASTGPGFEAGRRGKRHAHRRSGAVTSVDLTVISNELSSRSAGGSSAPSTPADSKRSLGNASPRETVSPSCHSSTTTSALNQPEPPAFPLLSVGGKDKDATPDARPPKPVVDNEPPSERPLSTTFSKTSDSVATVQPGVTARNSGSSTANEAMSAPRNSNKPRPRTADASFMLEPGANTNSVPRAKRPVSASGHAHPLRALSASFHVSEKRKSRSGNDLGGTPSKHSSDDECSDSSSDNNADSAVSSNKNGSSKSKKGQKKVRSWAGAILTRRKSKRRQSKGEDSTTTADFAAKRPPAITRTNSELGSDLDVDFDDDNIVVLRTPTDPNTPEPPCPDASNTEPSSVDTSWKPKSFYEQKEQDDSSNALIDLDAALGPFNTPDMRRPTSGTGFSAASSRMYSGGRRGEFVGPEMRYHRRTESAPEMPPFDRSSLRSSRLAHNTSSMVDPDVLYEEEEEDISLASGTQSPRTGGFFKVPANDLGANLSNPGKADRSDNRSIGGNDTYTMTRQQTLLSNRKGSLNMTQGAKEEKGKSPSPGTPCVCEEEKKSPGESAVTQERVDQPASSTSVQRKSSVEIFKREDHRPASSVVAPSPDISPSFVPVDKRKKSSVDLSRNVSQLSLQAGPLLHGSRPDLPSSSCGTPRSVATPSTDRYIPNPSFKDAFANPTHPSVEDVPSLTSSASTMTNNMHRLSASFFPRLSVDQSSTQFRPRRDSGRSQGSKRSSLVSLSKLVGHNPERSKLSHEEKPPTGESSDKKQKKGYRVSRLMQFWKSKDKEKSNHESARE